VRILADNTAPSTSLTCHSAGEHCSQHLRSERTVRDEECVPCRHRLSPLLVYLTRHRLAELQDMMPGIIPQLGNELLKRLQGGGANAGGAGEDDGVPEVDTFDS